MKMLVIFCDMLRGNTIENKGKFFFKNNLYAWLKNELLGTLYSNSYTGTPDTARGLGMIFSGLYPKNNGCDYKIKYPKFFLKKEKTYLYNILEEKNFNMKFYIDYKTYKLGNFPNFLKNNELKIIKNDSNIIENIKQELYKKENFFAFININDYHTTVDDYGANLFSDFLGKEKILKFLKRFFNEINKDEFDYIFILSDHGNKFDSKYKREKELLFLNTDRTNIVIFMRKKNEKTFKIDNELRSLVDLVPTIAEGLDINLKETDGISLEEKKIQRKIYIEDYSDFYSINDYKIWGYIDKENIYVTNLKKSLLLNKKNKIIKENLKLTKEIKMELEKGTIEFKRKNDLIILENYLKSHVYTLDYKYINGTNRFLILKQLKSKIKRKK